MKTKRILAAIAACAMSAAMLSMTVSAAGIDSDDDVISDDDIEDDGDDVDFVEPDEVETPAETEAPVQEAPAESTSPKTGNSPIALAVIPVALAAAAVVAKKAK
ncbi:MAG: hypothetical protein J1F11_01810 [Oscillospiraceae bacterium]|nr:hypothetical protein [Oscillospiraceae bacterium]